MGVKVTLAVQYYFTCTLQIRFQNARLNFCRSIISEFGEREGILNVRVWRLLEVIGPTAEASS